MKIALKMYRLIWLIFAICGLWANLDTEKPGIWTVVWIIALILMVIEFIKKEE